MKLSTTSFLITFVAHQASGQFLPLESNNGRRELYVKCSEDGKEVSMNGICCMDTAKLQSKMKLDGVDQNSYTSASGEVCSEIDAGFFANEDKYCHVTSDGKMKCEYDYTEDNHDCAQQVSDTCMEYGGKVFESNITLQCSGDVLFTVTNHMNCLAKTCGYHDVREYILTYLNTLNGKKDDCKFVEIDGVSVDTLNRQNAIKTVIGALFGFTLVAVYIYAKVSRHSARRTRGTYSQPGVVMVSPQLPLSTTKPTGNAGEYA